MAVPKPLLHVPYVYVMVVTFILPLSALATCVVLGLYLHFEGVTATHCRVPNFVPSISSIIGDFTPERYVWRLGMAFFSFPRIFDSFLYYNFFAHSVANSKLWYRLLNRATWLLHVWQYVSLFLLSYVTSSENFIIHRNSFISFIACSMFHMGAFLLLFRVGRQPPSKKDKLSLRLRTIFAVSHILTFIFSLYFYWRHNTYCEPYVYSYYGICEYIVVVTNIAFHTVEAVDFGNDFYISIAPPSRLKHN